MKDVTSRNRWLRSRKGSGGKGRVAVQHSGSSKSEGAEGLRGLQGVRGTKGAEGLKT